MYKCKADQAGLLTIGSSVYSYSCVVKYVRMQTLIIITHRCIERINKIFMKFKIQLMHNIMSATM